VVKILNVLKPLPAKGCIELEESNSNGLRINVNIFQIIIWIQLR